MGDIFGNEHHNDNSEYVQEYIGVNSARKGMVIMLKDQPCKISDITIYKPGKHGSAKALVLGYNILTDKKVQTIFSTSWNVPIPKMDKYSYTLIDVNENDNLLTILDSECHSRDYKLNCDDGLRSQIINEFNNATSVISIEILSCMGQDRILGIK